MKRTSEVVCHLTQSLKQSCPLQIYQHNCQFNEITYRPHRHIKFHLNWDIKYPVGSYNHLTFNYHKFSLSLQNDLPRATCINLHNYFTDVQMPLPSELPFLMHCWERNMGIQWPWNTLSNFHCLMHFYIFITNAYLPRHYQLWFQSKFMRDLHLFVLTYKCDATWKFVYEAMCSNPQGYINLKVSSQVIISTRLLTLKHIPLFYGGEQS